MRAGLLVAAWLRCVAAAAASSRRDEMLGVLCALREAPPRSDFFALQRSNPQHGCRTPSSRLGSKRLPVAVGYAVAPEPTDCFDLLSYFGHKGAELGFLKANLRPGREQALYDALIKDEQGKAKRYGGLFSQVNVATQLAFDAAAAGARVEFSSSPVHNGVAGHKADDYGSGCGGEASTAIARRAEERAELVPAAKPEKNSKGGEKKKEGGRHGHRTSADATMGCFFAPVDDAACAAARAPRDAAGAFRALAANWTRHEALAAFTEVLWRPSAAVRATTAAIRSALDLPAETRVALGVHARRGDRVSWEKQHVDAGFTFFDDAEWVDFFAQHTARGDVAVVLTQDDALAAKLARASAARGVRVVHVDAALKSADLPFGQFLVAAIALLAEADVVAANSGSNMGRAAFASAARRAARGPAAMHDFDGHWTAEDAARGYAPCLLQYLVRREGPKLDGCPGDAPAARASTREDRDYDERSAMHYAFRTVAPRIDHQEEKRDISVSKFAALVSGFIKDEFNVTVPPRYIRESYRQDMVECLLNVDEKKVTRVDQRYFAILRDDPGYERAFKEDAPKPSRFNAVSTEWRLAGLGANLCSRVC